MVIQERREPDPEFIEAVLLFALHIEATKSKGREKG